MPSAEILKHKAEEYGGFQAGRLTTEQVSQRLCCARFCSASGKVQMPVGFGGGFRVLCGRHAVLVSAMVLGALGETSPTSELRDMATRLGVDWNEFRLTEPRHPTTPETFVCLTCGGGYITETTGMFKGKRYIHTCGE